MNQVIIDNTILLSSAIIALLITFYTKRRVAGAVGSFFLLFAPLVIFINMWAHTVAVSIVNYKRNLAGNFHYSFPFYSLLFFGIVFIIASGINIHLARKRITGDVSVNKNIHLINIITALLFLPMMPINPIALLPVLASVVSSVSLRFLRPHRFTPVTEFPHR